CPRDVIQPAEAVRCGYSEPGSIGRKLHVDGGGFVRLGSCDFLASAQVPQLCPSGQSGRHQTVVLRTKAERKRGAKGFERGQDFPCSEFTDDSAKVRCSFAPV